MLGRLGTLIYRRRWLVLAVWALVIVLTAPLAPFASSRMTSGGFTNAEYRSSVDRAIIDEAFGLTSVEIIVIVRHPELSAYSAEFISGLTRIAGALADHPAVVDVETHLEEPELVSADARTVVVNAGLSTDIEDSLDVVQEVSDAIDPGEFEVIMTGGPPLYRDIVEASGADFRRGEAVALPLATLTLILVFGTLVAALIPVAIGGVAVATALGVLFWLTFVADLSILSFNIVSLLGIGMGIDYSLFYVSRFREERAAGKSIADAIAVAHSRAGVAILFAGLSSVIGLSSLWLFDLPVLNSVALGAAIVILLALAASLTLMPAILGIFGRHIERLRLVPRIGRVRWSFWDAVARFVMRWPVLVLIPTVALLVALVLPVRDLELGIVDPSILPRGWESREGAVVLEQEFGLERETVLLVAHTFDGDARSPEVLEQMYAFGQALEQVPDVGDVVSYVSVRDSLGPTEYADLYRVPSGIIDLRIRRLYDEFVADGVALFLVASDLHPSTGEARRLVAELRAFIPHEGGEIYVAGGAADLADQVTALYSRFPYVMAAVIALIFLSLLVQFRSLFIPLKAVFLNVLGIFAAYGALVWVFQWGNLSGLLGFDPVGAIETTTPIMLFAVVFGLSLDYEIFLMSRIREAHRAEAGARESVRRGLQATGAIITGAGMILVVVAASFLVADIVIVKAVGLGLGLAILLDITVVRLLVAPALMRLMGEWNWWLPRWLDRLLPQIG